MRKNSIASFASIVMVDVVLRHFTILCKYLSQSRSISIIWNFIITLFLDSTETWIYRFHNDIEIFEGIVNTAVSSSTYLQLLLLRWDINYIQYDEWIIFRNIYFLIMANSFLYIGYLAWFDMIIYQIFYTLLLVIINWIQFIFPNNALAG